jgi:hypothetical protein
MDPADIAAEVEAANADWAGRAVPHLVDIVPLAIRRGITADADLVFLAAMAEGHVRCGLVCGASLVVGPGMHWAMMRYCGGERKQAESLMRRCTQETAAALRKSRIFVSVLRGSDERWRSFRGERLLSFEERFAVVSCDRN